MSNKKLIYIVNEYSDKSVQHFFHIINLLKKMAEKDVEIVLVIEKCLNKPTIDNPNIHVVAQKETKKIRRANELKSILVNYMKQGYNKVFVRISTNAAIIAIRQAKKYGADVYYWNSGDNLTYDKQKKGLDKLKWLVTGYSKLCYIRDNVNYFVTGPETMIKYYIDNLGVKPEKMLLLYNDIDTSRFVEGSAKAKNELRNSLNIPQDGKIVLFVHRLTPVKRFYLQIPFVAECEEFVKANGYLVVIGGGPDEKQIIDNINNSKYKDRIRFLGPKSNSEIQNFYSGADLFINPSYSEGFPRVVIEAMGCGLPVVTSDVGGTKDILTEAEKEYLIDKDNKELFRKKVIKLLNDDKKREIMGKENRIFVQRFSTESVSQMYIDAIWG